MESVNDAHDGSVIMGILAANYIQLLLYRIGVGVGEAGS